MMTPNRSVRPWVGTSGCFRRDAHGRGLRAKDRRIVRAARVPEHPALDPQLLRGADLLPHLGRRVAWLAQGERLEVGPDLGSLAQRAERRRASCIARRITW